MVRCVVLKIPEYCVVNVVSFENKAKPEIQSNGTIAVLKSDCLLHETDVIGCYNNVAALLSNEG